jgi:hypothetical protein
MTLRLAYRPLHPDLDGFLFAAVGDEKDGIPLSMVSALTRLDLDPWAEAGRLSSLSRREAVEQLARLLTDLPGMPRPLPESRQIAEGLVERLPKNVSDPVPPVRPRRWVSAVWPSQFWVIFFVLAAAGVVGAILYGGFPFGWGTP